MKRYWLLLALIIPTASFSGFMCPTNFKQIDFGNTTLQVMEQCGKPDRIDEKEVPIEVPQEWVFFVPQTVASSSMNQVTGTLRSSFAFDKDGIILNMSVNGIGVGSTTICNGAIISLGDTMETVKAACGKPVYINKSEPIDGNDVQRKNNKITTFIYNTNPSTTLTFVEGILQSKSP